MIVSSAQLLDTPVMSLQTGSQIARTIRAIIDPSILEIIGFEVGGPLVQKQTNLLSMRDVRELSNLGFIIDSSDELIALGDVIKLDEIYHLNFELLDMTVRDEHRHKLGKINGYTVDTSGFLVQQISVKRPLIKSLNDTELLIHRSQITEINDHEIIVHSEAEIPEPTAESIQTSYVNPFRKNTPEPEHIDQK